MVEVVVLLVIASAIAIGVPAVVIVRTLRLQRELEALRARLDRLERRGSLGPPIPLQPDTVARPLETRETPVTQAVPPPSPVPIAPPPVAPRPAAPPPATIPASPPRAEPADGPMTSAWAGFSAADRAARTSGDPEQIERQIGERLLLYAGMIVLVLGVVFFLRYAFDQQWLSPAVRITLGVVTGASLVALGQTLAARGYRAYGLFVSGGGIAVLFLSVYAAFALYAMIGRVLAFVLLAVVAAGAALLADRHRALPLAVMAVSGGFAAPFLVGGHADAQVLLFSYDAVLIGATMFLARRRGWMGLNVVALLLTIVTMLLWAQVHYTPDKYLRTELFMTLYLVMFSVMLRDSLRSSDASAADLSLVLWGVPPLYHVASVLLLQAHPQAYLIYSVVMAVAVAAASIALAASWLRLLGAGAILLPLLLWVGDNQLHRWTTWEVAAVIAIGGAFVVTLQRVASRGERLDRWDVALLHVNSLAIYGGLHQALAPFVAPWTMAAIAAVLAAGHAGMAAATRRLSGPAAGHWFAAAAALAAVAITILVRPSMLSRYWVAAASDGETFARSLTLSAAWATYAALLVAAGMRQHLAPVRYCGIVLFGLTLLKVFTLDLQQLSGLYRVIGFVVVGAILLLVSFLYQQSRKGEIEPGVS